MDLETKILVLERLVRIGVGLFLVGLAVLQPVPLSTIWMLVLSVVGLGIMADSLRSFNVDSGQSDKYTGQRHSR